MIFHVTRYAHVKCDLWVVGERPANGNSDNYIAYVFHVIRSRSPKYPEVTGEKLYLESDDGKSPDLFTLVDVADLPDDILAKLMEFKLCPS